MVPPTFVLMDYGFTWAKGAHVYCMYNKSLSKSYSVTVHPLCSKNRIQFIVFKKKKCAHLLIQCQLMYMHL